MLNSTEVWYQALEVWCVGTTICFLFPPPGPVRLEGEVNVLLVGTGDPRHILKTIAGVQNEESLHVSLSVLICHVTPENKISLLYCELQTSSLCSTAGVGDRKQHGGGSQTAAAPLPGTDAPGKHGK